VLPLFFADNLSGGNSQLLDKDEAHHAIKVLRVKIGEEIMISDGSGNWVSGPIEELGKKTLLIKVSNQGQKKLNKPELVIVQAITKSDRNKEMLELITVAGVDRIIPWQSDRSISKWQSDSADKWESTIKESCKQARRVVMPKLSKSINSKQLAEELISVPFSIIFHEAASTNFSDVNVPSDIASIYLIIGPEGGITDEELLMFKGTTSNIVRLGEPVLRSAHAGFAALAAVQTKLGRW
jgi:16S rRNA (uracil1498-N3)-methyltransferase